MAGSLNHVKEKRGASIGAVDAMATSLAAFTVLAAEGIDPDKFIQLGFTSIDLFPFLQGLLLSTLLLTIAYPLPWKWAATSVVASLVIFMIISQIVVPPPVTWLMLA